MVKMSLLVMLALTILIAFGLYRREEAQLPLVARQRAKLRRYGAAGAAAVAATLVLFGALHWLRVGTGG